MIDRFLNLDYNRHANNPVGVVSTTRCLGRGRGLRPYRPRPLKRNHPLTTLPSTAIGAIATAFLQAGYAVNGIAAVCGNGMLESGLKPINPSNDGSDGFLQWRDGPGVTRLTQMKNWCASQKLNWQTIESQALYAIHELSTTAEYSNLNAELKDPSRSVDNLTLNFCDIYERPAASGRVPNTRIAYAEESLPIIQLAAHNVPAPAPATPTPTPTQAPPTVPTIPIPAPATGFEMPPALTAALGQLVVAAAQWLLTTIIQAHTTTAPAATTTTAPVKVTTTSPSANTATTTPDLTTVLSSLITPLAQALAAELAKVSAAAPPSPPQA